YAALPRSLTQTLGGSARARTNRQGIASTNPLNAVTPRTLPARRGPPPPFRVTPAHSHVVRVLGRSNSPQQRANRRNSGSICIMKYCQRGDVPEVGVRGPRSPVG